VKNIESDVVVRQAYRALLPRTNLSRKLIRRMMFTVNLMTK